MDKLKSLFSDGEEVSIGARVIAVIFIALFEFYRIFDPPRGTNEILSFQRTLVYVDEVYLGLDLKRGCGGLLQLAGGILKI